MFKGVKEGNFFAVKIFRRKKFSWEEQIKIFESELLHHKNFYHPNILKIFEHGLEKEFVLNGVKSLRDFIVTEICVDLFDIVKSTADIRMEEPEAWFYFKQLLEGIEYLHSQGYSHCDLKLDNILIKDLETVVICDFGHTQD